MRFLRVFMAFMILLAGILIGTGADFLAQEYSGEDPSPIEADDIPAEPDSTTDPSPSADETPAEPDATVDPSPSADETPAEPDSTTEPSPSADEIPADPDATIDPSPSADAPSEPTEDTGPKQFPPENAGDFWFAYFDVKTNLSVKTQVSGVILRFLGTLDTIDPSLLTDVVLTRNGEPIESSLSLTTRKDQYQYNYKDITDFYFKFNEDVSEPGTYGLSGRYNGEAFSVYNKIIEAPLGDNPANPDDLLGVGFVFYPDENDRPIKISEVSFQFHGKQDAFYPEDLTDFVLTLNGEPLPFTYMARVFRYFEYNQYKGGGDTSFSLVFNEAFTLPGTYAVSGQYKGIPFSSDELTIP